MVDPIVPSSIVETPIQAPGAPTIVDEQVESEVARLYEPIPPRQSTIIMILTNIIALQEYRKMTPVQRTSIMVKLAPIAKACLLAAMLQCCYLRFGGVG